MRIVTKLAIILSCILISTIIAKDNDLINLSKNLRSLEEVRYDSYVLSFQWGSKEIFLILGSFCVSHDDTAACLEKLKQVEKNSFSLHGLWPSLKSGDKINECGGTAKIVPDASETYQNMAKVWASFSNSNVEFWDHEFNKHGYCYNQHVHKDDPKVFFQKTLDVFFSQKYKNFYDDFKKPGPNDAYEFEYLQTKLNTSFGKGFKMFCVKKDGDQFLSEIRVFMDMDFKIFDGTHWMGQFCKTNAPIRVLDFDRKDHKKESIN